MTTSIGGSDIAAAMGLNPYKDFMALVQTKIDLLKGIKEVITAYDMWWGTCFESLIREYIQRTWGCEIVGDSICISMFDSILRCSPDGYTIMNDGTPIMFEFKCPTRRIPKKGETPKYYTPQVWLGMSMTPFVQYGVFVDSIFRRCSWNDLNTTLKYNNVYHNKDTKTNLVDAGRTSPIACGVAGIYAPIGWNLTYSAVHKVNGKYQDCGAIDDEMLFSVFKYIYDDKVLKISKQRFYIDTDMDVMNKEEALEHYIATIPDGYYLYGLLPFKLFRSEFVKILPKSGFLEVAREHAIRVDAAVKTHLKYIEDHEISEQQIMLDERLVRSSSSTPVSSVSELSEPSVPTPTV
jgi:hypothetical protein